MYHSNHFIDIKNQKVLGRVRIAENNQWKDRNTLWRIIPTPPSAQASTQIAAIINGKIAIHYGELYQHPLGAGQYTNCCNNKWKDSNTF